MIDKLNAIKKLRKTRKLLAEEELNKLEKEYNIKSKDENIVLKIKKTKTKIDQLEKDLKDLKILEKKFKED